MNEPVFTPIDPASWPGAQAFVSDGDRITMPLSVTVHHAATDGWHLKEFLELLQSFMDHPEQWL